MTEEPMTEEPKYSSVELNFTGTVLSEGAFRIFYERQRVMGVKGRTIESDANYTGDQLIDAAIAYMWDEKAFWPWDESYFKAGQDRVQDLVRAGQFIAAEIDRLLAEAANSVNPVLGNGVHPETLAPSRVPGTEADQVDFSEETPDSNSP